MSHKTIRSIFYIITFVMYLRCDNSNVRAQNIIGDNTPQWFAYLSEHLVRITHSLSVLEHYSDLHSRVSRLQSWCDRHTSSESQHTGNLQRTPCGKITIKKSGKIKSIWRIKVNTVFNVILNFTRFSVDASVGRCRHSSLT